MANYLAARLQFNQVDEYDLCMTMAPPSNPTGSLNYLSRSLHLGPQELCWFVRMFPHRNNCATSTRFVDFYFLNASQVVSMARSQHLTKIHDQWNSHLLAGHPNDLPPCHSLMIIGKALCAHWRYSTSLTISSRHNLTMGNASKLGYLV